MGCIGRRARTVRILGPAQVMASADLSSPRGRTQYPYALLEPWLRSGPPPVSSARVHANIGRHAARRSRAVRMLPLSGIFHFLWSFSTELKSEIAV